MLMEAIFNRNCGMKLNTYVSYTKKTDLFFPLQKATREDFQIMKSCCV